MSDSTSTGSSISNSTSTSGIQSFLAFDWGQLRVGVASGNSMTRQAQSVITLTEQGAARDAIILRLVKEWRPNALVVGVPFHPDGAPHKNTQNAKNFAKALRNLTGLSVIEVDERYSTTEAKAGWVAQQKNDNRRSVKNMEKKLDALSACVILEQHLRSLA